MLECIVNVLLSSEYLATFKKTVAMHEVFLQRCAAHPALRNDVNFKVFLEYDQDVSEIYFHMTYIACQSVNQKRRSRPHIINWYTVLS